MICSKFDAKDAEVCKLRDILAQNEYPDFVVGRKSENFKQISKQRHKIRQRQTSQSKRQGDQKQLKRPKNKLKVNPISKQ